jgi:hypothetical protein
VNDVAPIALASETGFIVDTPSVASGQEHQELIAYDKGNPGKLNYGSSGAGGGNHLATELFNQMVGTKMTHLPYKGTSLAMNDLLGGHIQLIFGAVPLVAPQVKANRLRGIAVTTAKRLNAMPDIPIVGETVPGYEVVQWFAVLGPKALSKDVVARWNSEVNRILQLSDMKERLAGDGMELWAGSPERFRELLKRDVAKWQKVVKIAGINRELDLHLQNHCNHTRMAACVTPQTSSCPLGYIAGNILAPQVFGRLVEVEIKLVVMDRKSGGIDGRFVAKRCGISAEAARIAGAYLSGLAAKASRFAARWKNGTASLCEAAVNFSEPVPPWRP